MGFTEDGTVTVKVLEFEPRDVLPLYVVTVTVPDLEVEVGIWSHHAVGIVKVCEVATFVKVCDLEPSETTTLCV